MATQKEGKTISLGGKLDILWHIDRCMGTCMSLAKQLGLSVSTLNIVVRKANHCEPIVKKLKCLKKSKFEELEEILKGWFANIRSSNV
jgi:hypothetical protein